jgi:hypothetical protein
MVVMKILKVKYNYEVFQKCFSLVGVLRDENASTKYLFRFGKTCIIQCSEAVKWEFPFLLRNWHLLHWEWDLSTKNTIENGMGLKFEQGRQCSDGI